MPSQQQATISNGVKSAMQKANDAIELLINIYRLPFQKVVLFGVQHWYREDGHLVTQQDFANASGLHKAQISKLVNKKKGETNDE